MKKIKKLTAVIMTIVMLLTVVPFTGIGFTKAGALNAAGQLNDTISYTFDKSTGTLTISGTGDMPNYKQGESPFNSEVKKVNIKYGVTNIGDYIFFCCDNLTSITIPQSVKSIGRFAIYNCDSLTSITIPQSITSIGNFAFYDCESLTSITIPNSVTSIGLGAFEYCTGLKSLTIGNGVTSIDDNAFSNCGSFTRITVNGNNPFYDSRDNCNAIIETATNTLIVGCKNTIIPNGVKSIGDFAFDHCTDLTSITIPDSVTSIGNCAFESCTSLTEVTVPDSITSIEDWAFIMCNSLTDVYYGGTEEEWNAISIGNNNSCLLNANIHFADPYGRIFLNDTVYYTFDEETGTLKISGTGDMPNYNYAKSPFYNNSSIKNIIIEDGVTSIGNFAFYDCGSLTSITIPDSVTSIGEYAFDYCKSLTSVTIPDSVTSIDDKAFRYCRSLTSITIPDSVTSIGDGAFYECESLTSVSLGNGVTSIDEDVFAICENLTSITIPESVTSIGDYAFNACTSLTSITIPESVTSIGYHAFNACTSLTSITIPNNVTSIGNGVFYDCESLTSITIPDGVTSIGDCTFEDCISLTEIMIPASVTSIGDWAFDNCNSLTEITIPASVTSIGDSAFKYCDSLTRITIPDSVTSIGDGVFNSCRSLTSIKIPASVTNIGEDAFGCCHDLTDVYYGGTEEEWNAIEIGEFNEDLLNANIHFAEPDDGRIYLNDTVYYIFDESTGTLTIGGTGDMPDYYWESSPFCYSSSIESIVIEDGITSIGDCAFNACTSLISITIPASVISIGDDAFSCCPYLFSITVDRDNPVYDSRENCNAIIEKDTHTLIAGCGSTIIPDGVTSIGRGAFYGSTVFQITIPDSVTSIGVGAFYCCQNLSYITIPGSVTSIGDLAFYDCDSFTSITIPYGVTSIGDSAFKYCDNLTEATIPDSVTSIGEDAFWGCNSLTDVYYGGTEEEWNAIAIKDGNNYLLNASIHFLGEPADYTAVFSAIESANSLNSNDFTEETWANVTNAINAVVYDLKCTQQAEVDAMADAINNAINALEKAHIHTLKHIVVPSTCTVQGMEYDLCTGCRKTMNQTVLPLAEHTWGEWVRTLEPTTKEEGVEERTCSVCGAVETRFIEKLNEIVDEKTGISITYGDEFTEGVEVDVVEEFDGTSFQILSADYDGNVNFRMFDITPSVDGEKTQPTGTVTVRIPVPAEFNGTDIFVVYVNSEKGTTEDMPCTVVDGYIEFQTTHFSHYAICQLIKAVRNVKLSDLTIKHNGKASLNPVITADDGAKYTVRYESYDKSVADVDKDGTVNAVNSGETIIRCTIKDECGNLISDTCKVTVGDSFIQHFFRVFLSRIFGEKFADKVMAYFINLAK